MGIKTNNEWVKYKRLGEIIEITIRDGGGQKIGNFKCTNNKDYSRVIKIIENKFGYSPTFKGEFNKEKKDINWLDKDMEW